MNIFLQLKPRWKSDHTYYAYIHSYITLFCLVRSVFSSIARSTIPYGPWYFSNYSTKMMDTAFPFLLSSKLLFVWLTNFGNKRTHPYLRGDDDFSKCCIIYLSCVSAGQTTGLKVAQWCPSLFFFFFLIHSWLNYWPQTLSNPLKGVYAFCRASYLQCSDAK